MKKSFFLIFVFAFIVLLSNIGFALGTCHVFCTIDQPDYVTDSILTFSCYCDSAAEENIDGNIVIRDSIGNVLQNESVNSGNCLTSMFYSQYDVGSSNFTGNVTLETTGATWCTTEIYDDFSVSLADYPDCVIKDIEMSDITLGKIASFKMNLYDGKTLEPIVGARCVNGAYSPYPYPIHAEPYNQEMFSTAEGEFGFQHKMSELVWDTDTTYLYEFHCTCPDNASEEECYSETTGNRLNFHSCTVQVPFTTEPMDYRELERNSNTPIAVIIILIIFYFAIGLYGTIFNSKILIIQVFGYILSFFHLLAAIFVIYMNYAMYPIINMIEIIFYGNLLIAFAVIFFALIMFTIRLIHPKESVGEDEKWRKM